MLKVQLRTQRCTLHPLSQEERLIFFSQDRIYRDLKIKTNCIKYAAMFSKGAVDASVRGGTPAILKCDVFCSKNEHNKNKSVKSQHCTVFMNTVEYYICAVSPPQPMYSSYVL